MNMNLLANSSSIWLFVILGILILIISIVLALLPVKIWFRCLVSGTYLSMSRLIGMKLRNIDVPTVVNSYINAKKGGINLSIMELETHTLAGGNVSKVVEALISAHSAKIPLTVETAKAIDLAGRDVLTAVKESVTPKVIETPVISTIAMDAIELKIKARVTVKTNINKLVGGSGEETIISRVGEGIVTAVGGAATHNDVLQNPDMISKVVVEKGLDDGTAYKILSVDIADIDVGRNIGADLQKSQAEADKDIAQAKAEERRSMAVAKEQEMRAMKSEAEAKVIEAEVAIPKAMAEAFRKGKMGVMDYYKIQNIEADTSMRSAFGSKKKK